MMDPQILDLLDCPAFLVRDGVIVNANEAALCRRFQIGHDVGDYLFTGKDEYGEYHGGTLHLMLSSGEEKVSADVVRIDGTDLFRLTPDRKNEQLQAMVLTASMLRSPLAKIMPAADRLRNREDPPAEIAQINHGLYEILRMVNHMSYASDQSSATMRMETQEMCSTVQEILEKAATLLEYTGVKLEYSVPETRVFSLVNRYILEMAIYDLISNAVKFSPKGSTVTARLTIRGKKLYLTVEDRGEGIAPEVSGKIFSMYSREAGIEDGRHGIGLGMPLVHHMATAHGGTVLVEKGEEGGTRVTVVLAIRPPEAGSMRSPRIIIDPTGGWDNGLIGLSDVLPKDAFRKS